MKHAVTYSPVNYLFRKNLHTIHSRHFPCSCGGLALPVAVHNKSKEEGQDYKANKDYNGDDSSQVVLPFLIHFWLLTSCDVPHNNSQVRHTSQADRAPLSICLAFRACAGWLIWWWIVTSTQILNSLSTLHGVLIPSLAVVSSHGPPVDWSIQ